MQDYYTADQHDPTRRLWKGIFYGLTLSAAIAGLIGCLTWLTCAVCSI